MVRLVPAELSHVNELCTLEVELFPASAMGPDTLRRELSAGLGYLAQDGELWVGYVLGRPGPLNEVTRLGVVREHRGKGIGGALLASMLVSMPGHTMLAVEKTNPAVGLYVRHGFRIVSELEGSWLMRKS